MPAKTPAPKAETVSAFPRKTRSKKYPLETWFNGDIHRLVKGVHFHIKESSMRTTLYNAASAANFDVKVQWEIEDGEIVAYVGPKPPKEAPATTKAKTKPKAKSTKAKA